MAHCSRSVDVKVALDRAKKKISGLEHKLSSLGTVSDGEEEEEVRALPWTQSKELKDSLVDMYKANPNVNRELRHRLSPPHGNTAVTHGNAPGTARPKHLATPPGVVCLQSSSPPSCPGSANMEAVAAAPSPAPCIQSDTKDHAPFTQVDGGGHAPLGSTDSRTLSRERNVSFLLKELDSLRSVNNKLQLQLVHKQKEVEDRQLGEEPRTSPQLLPQAVLQELCAAQRDRDQAMMSRLRLANEERDEALLRAKHLHQAAQGMDETTTELNLDAGVEEVLASLLAADSAPSVQQRGAELLALLQKARQRSHDITTQEMVALIHQRDHASAKLNRLEQLSRENNQTTHDVYKEELQRAERERDAAIDQNHALEEQLRTNTRLHGEAQQDRGTRPCQPPGPGDGASELGTDQQPAGPRLQRLSRQQQHLEQQLQTSLQAEREACAKIHKLERLVEVLRKKLGTGSLRPVI